MEINDIIIAEDNPRDQAFILETLEIECNTGRGFTQRMPTIHTAGNGAQALSLALEINHVYLISDIQMPEMTGIELSRQLWHKKPLTKIIFWSNYSDEIYLRSLLKIIPAETVYGYVLKNKSASDLCKAIIAVFNDEQCWIDPEIRPVQARSQQKPSFISDAEFEVLVDISLGLTDNLIAKKRYLSRRGVQNRLKSLYSKLGVDNLNADEDMAINSRSRATAIALQRGLLNVYELKKQEAIMHEWIDNLDDK